MPVSNGIWISNFLEFLKYECDASERSIAAHEQSLADLAAWLEPALLPEATRVRLQLYLGDCLHQGISARTVARRLSHIRHFFQMLSKEQRIDRDPTFDLAMPKHYTKTKGRIASKKKKARETATIVTWFRMDSSPSVFYGGAPVE
jgi:integrase/recombinase XerD